DKAHGGETPGLGMLGKRADDLAGRAYAARDGQQRKVVQVVAGDVVRYIAQHRVERWRSVLPPGMTEHVAGGAFADLEQIAAIAIELLPLGQHFGRLVE